MITPKEIERKNIILWYGLYATEKEMEMARTNNKETLDRVLKEYAEEVDRIDKTKRLYERIIQSRTIQMQGLGATLKTNFSSRHRKSDPLEKP